MLCMYLVTRSKQWVFMKKNEQETSKMLDDFIDNH